MIDARDPVISVCPKLIKLNGIALLISPMNANGRHCSMIGFNEELASLDNTAVLCVSADLPYAQKRFCGSEGLDRVKTASTFRSTFSDDYGVTVLTGIRRGLTARVVVVIDPAGIVKHVELVEEVSTEPDYEAALAVL